MCVKGEPRMAAEYRKPEFWCAFSCPEKYSEERDRFDRLFDLFNPEEETAFREALKEEINRRQEAFRRAGAEDYERYRFMEQTGIAQYQWFPRLYVLVDDPKSVMMLTTKGNPDNPEEKLHLFPAFDHLGIRIFCAVPIVTDPERVEKLKKRIY